MPKLSDVAVRQYHEHGYYAPIRALSAQEAGEVRRHLEAYEADAGSLRGPLRHKAHLLFTWLDELIRHPGILDPGGKHHRPEHPGLGNVVLHQGAE